MVGSLRKMQMEICIIVIQGLENQRGHHRYVLKGNQKMKEAMSAIMSGETLEEICKRAEKWKSLKNNTLRKAEGDFMMSLEYILETK